MNSGLTKKTAAPRHLAPRAPIRPRSAALPRLWVLARFPVLVWAAWRAVQLVLVVVFGGDVVDATFYFDGGWFRSILDQGYVVTDPSFETQQNPAFMPGVAWLAWPFAKVVGAEAAALLVANATGAAAFCAVYGATRSWSGERAARVATVALALWPTSFVLWAYYSEGLFILATALGLWADRRGRPAAAMAGCFLAPLTRTVGGAFGPVLAVARWWRLGRVDLGGVSYIAASLAATGTVSAVQETQTGDALAWVHAQSSWGREMSFPWSPIISAVADAGDKLPRPAMELSINLAAVALVGFSVGVLVVWWIRDRLPLSVTAWAGVAWLAPLFTTIISSQIRFALGAWPVLVAWSHEGRWGRVARAIGALAGIALTVLFLRRWATNVWVA